MRSGLRTRFFTTSYSSPFGALFLSLPYLVSSGERPASDHTVYGKRFWGDLKELSAKPAYWSKGQWLLAGGVLAAAGGSLFVDASVADFYGSHRIKFLYNLSTSVPHFGDFPHQGPLISGLWVEGYAFGSTKVRHIAADASEARSIPGLIINPSLYYITGRMIPSQGGSQRRFRPFTWHRHLFTSERRAQEEGESAPNALQLLTDGLAKFLKAIRRIIMKPGIFMKAVLAAAVVLSGSALRAEGVKGSIKVKRGDVVSYSKLAKTSIADVVKAVNLKYPKALMKSVRLQEEDGWLVYEALFMASGKRMDVKVDAGNGGVLKEETGGNDDSKKEVNEKNDGKDERENDAYGENREDGPGESAGKEKKDGETGAGKESGPKASISLAGVGENAIYGLASVTMPKAVESALAAFPGKAVKAELENENGGLVYGVEIISAAGKTSDVKIDAGNGKVLALEKDGEKDEEDGGKDEEKDEHGEHRD